MQTRLLIAVICGLAAALCNLGPLTGSALGFMMSMAAPLPIFLAGLMQGWVLALVASILASVATLLVAGDTAALLFAATAALPATLLVRQALLAQSDADGNLVWYPVTRLAYWLGGLGLAMGVVTIFVLGQGALDTLAEGVIAMADPEGRIDAAGREILVGTMNRVAPAIIAASLVITLVINGAYAQRIVERLQKGVRPHLPLTSLKLPVMAAAALAVLVLVSMGLSGMIGQVALIMATMIGLLFMLQGLVVIHLKARNHANGTLILVGTYLIVLFTMPVLGPIPLLVIMALGIADTFINVRPATPGAGT